MIYLLTTDDIIQCNKFNCETYVLLDLLLYLSIFILFQIHINDISISKLVLVLTNVVKINKFSYDDYHYSNSVNKHIGFNILKFI